MVLVVDDVPDRSRWCREPLRPPGIPSEWPLMLERAIGTPKSLGYTKGIWSP
jgi:hypothetical protein